MSQGHFERRGVRTTDVPASDGDPTALVKWIKATNHAIDRAVQEATHLRGAVVRAWARMRELRDEAPAGRDIWERRDLAEITTDPLGPSAAWRMVAGRAGTLLRVLLTSPAPRHLADLDAVTRADPGIRLHVVVDARLVADPETRTALDMLRGRHVTVRIRQHIPVDMWLADTAGLARFAYGDGINGLLVHSPFLLAAYAQLFDHLWDDPLTATCRVPEPGPTSRQQWVIRLLATGLSDAEIATLLGVNIRTVRRHIADAMRQLGASNRAGAGLLAAQRDWV